MEGIIKEWKNLPKDQRSYSMNMEKETIEEINLDRNNCS
jgi:hypothetical protein